MKTKKFSSVDCQDDARVNLGNVDRYSPHPSGGTAQSDTAVGNFFLVN